MGDIKRKKSPNDETEEKPLHQDPFVSVKGAQDLCGLRMETIRRAIQIGELKARRFLAETNGSLSQQSRYLIRASDLRDWIDRRTMPA